MPVFQGVLHVLYHSQPPAETRGERWKREAPLSQSGCRGDKRNKQKSDKIIGNLSEKFFLSFSPKQRQVCVGREIRLVQGNHAAAFELGPGQRTACLWIFSCIAVLLVAILSVSSGTSTLSVASDPATGQCGSSQGWLRSSSRNPRRGRRGFGWPLRCPGRGSRRRRWPE